jgi:hypothetical protein
LIWDDSNGPNRYTHVYDYKTNRSKEYKFIEPVYVKYKPEDYSEAKKVANMLLTVNKPNTVSRDEIKKRIVNSKRIDNPRLRKHLRIGAVYIYIHRLVIALDQQMQLINILFSKTFKTSELQEMRQYMNVTEHTSIIVCLILQNKKIDIIDEYIEKYRMYDLYNANIVKSINSLINIIKYIVGCYIKLASLLH